MIQPDLSQLSMLDLFRVEAETQALVLASGLLALERDPRLADELEACMRAAHSLKGAARIVGLAAGVRIAHAMEDCFVAAQHGRVTLGQAQIDLLLGATDLLARIAHTVEAEIGRWDDEKKPEVDLRLAALAGLLAGDAPAGRSVDDAAPVPAPAPEEAAAEPDRAGHFRARRASDRVLRVSAENLNRLLSLAGESLVESRWINPFAESLLRLKRLHH
jgi:two-component system sensor histidine kinase and response regulator WspE